MDQQSTVGGGVREMGDIHVDGGLQGRDGLAGDMGIDGSKRPGAGLSRYR